MSTPTSALLQLMAARDALPQDPTGAHSQVRGLARLRLEAMIINALWEPEDAALGAAVEDMRRTLVQLMNSTRVPVDARRVFAQVWSAMRTVEMAERTTPDTAADLVS